jgi:anti-sigma factor RsiW
MTCGQCRENLSAYADGDLGPAEKISADAHLAGCAGCRAELRFIQKAKAAIAGSPSPRMPESLKQALLDEARRRGRQEAPRPSLWSIPAFRYPAAALAATFAALLVVLAVNRENQRPTISLDAMAAHEEYALSRPLAPADIIYSRLPEQVETAAGNPHDL